MKKQKPSRKALSLSTLADGEILFTIFDLTSEFIILRNNKQLINEFFNAIQNFEPNYLKAKRIWSDIERSASARVNQHGLTEAIKELNTLIDKFRGELDRRKRLRPQDFKISGIKEKVEFS